MRISELLEGKDFRDMDFVSNIGDKKDINFDLVEDLVFFMNNNDDIYRRHLYPMITKCQAGLAANKPVSPNIFRSAVEESYDSYIKQYPINQLPAKLTDETCSQVCKTMYEEVCKSIKDGKYKV